MNRHLRILLAGVMVIVPLAATVYLVWRAGAALHGLASSLIGAVLPGAQRFLFPGAGVLVVLIGIYLIGLLTHWWVFRRALGLLERALSRLPVVKTIYESIRDVLKLFGGDAEQMGQVVRLRLPGTDIRLLGIRTSTSPRGAKGEQLVAVYLPMSYMFGGPTVYVPPEAVDPVDLTVEEALKIAATADAGQAAETPHRSTEEPAAKPPSGPAES